MELKAMYCPSCGSPLNIDTTGRQYVFCSYCGCQIHIDDGTEHKEITINENVHIHDDAMIEAEKTKVELQKLKNERKEDFENLFIVILSFVMTPILLFFLYFLSQ